MSHGIDWEKVQKERRKHRFRMYWKIYGKYDLIFIVFVLLLLIGGWKLHKAICPVHGKKAETGSCYICGHNECENPNKHELPKWMHYHADGTNLCVCEDYPNELDSAVIEILEMKP